MDEEELEQSNKKITIDNFFESISSIDEVANRALQQSQENFNLVSVNSNLLQGLEESIQLIESDIQQITNYFIVQQDQRRKQLEIREQELSKRQDISQKQIGGRLQDVAPFENRPRNFGDSLLRGAAGLAQDITRPFIGPGIILGLSGLLGFKDGGEPPVNEPSIVGEGGPEIFVPKTSGTIIPNDASKLLAGLSNAADTNNTTKLLAGLSNAADTNNTTKLLTELSNDADTNKSKKKVKNPYEVDPNSKDFSILTAISALEGGDSQSRVDVAQSIYNRFDDVKSDISDGKMDDAAFDYTKSSFKADESGKFPKLTLSDILLKEGQYQPAFKDPTKTEGTIAPEFSNITDKDTAILAMKSYFDKRGDKRSMKDIEKLFDQTSKDLQNEKLVKSAQEHVGGNTEFLSSDSYQEGDAYRGKSGVDNTFFTKYGSGNQVKSGAAPSPLLKSDDSSSPLLKSDDSSSPLLKSDDSLSSLLKSDNNFNVNVDKSAKNELISQNMLAPPEKEDDVVTLPPIGGGGGDEPIETTPSPFGSSNSQSDQITGTESGIPFIDVISNPFLSVV